MNKLEEMIYLDVSELESPLPLQMILKTISENHLNKTIIVTHRLEPLGLFPYLKNLKMQYKCVKEQNNFIITIWK